MVRRIREESELGVMAGESGESTGDAMRGVEESQAASHAQLW